MRLPGLVQVEKASGPGRESLYKALARDRMARFETTATVAPEERRGGIPRGPWGERRRRGDDRTLCPISKPGPQEDRNLPAGRKLLVERKEAQSALLQKARWQGRSALSIVRCGTMPMRIGLGSRPLCPELTCHASRRRACRPSAFSFQAVLAEETKSTFAWSTLIPRRRSTSAK